MQAHPNVLRVEHDLPRTRSRFLHRCTATGRMGIVRFGWAVRSMAVCGLLAGPTALSARAADIGTALTYQGFLERPAGTAATDACRFAFMPCDDATAECAPRTVSNHPGISVTDGILRVPDVDFGARAFIGEPSWTGVDVQCTGDGGLVALSPRVELTPAPYALRAAESVGPAGVLNVTPEGNVGIGTTTPAQKLHVNGNARIDSTLFAHTISGLSPLTISTNPSTSSDDIIFLTAGNEVARFKEGGKVGVGTMVPSHKLHVHNGALFLSADGNNIPGLGGPMILLGGGTPADANGVWGIEYDPGAGGLNFWKPFPNPFGWGNYFLFLANNGRVGIGTPTPNEQLEITGNLRLPPSTASVGVIKSGGQRFIHGYGQQNIFAGIDAGNFTLTGHNNTAVGAVGLFKVTSGSDNTGAGAITLYNNTTGYGNTAVGVSALWGNAAGTLNTAVGVGALDFNFNGTNNTAIGSGADVGFSNLTNATAVGASAIVSASNSLVLGGTGANAVSVGIRTAIPRAELDVVGTGAIVVPVGTTAQRPPAPVLGMIRFNTTTGKFEGYDGSSWQTLN